MTDIHHHSAQRTEEQPELLEQDPRLHDGSAPTPTVEQEIVGSVKEPAIDPTRIDTAVQAGNSLDDEAEDTSPARVIKGVAGAGAALLAGMLFMSTQNDSEPQGEEITPAAETVETTPSSITTLPPSETTITVDAPVVTTPETANVTGPVAITANTPQGMADQMAADYECALNNPDLSVQEECLINLVGDPNSNAGVPFKEQIDAINAQRRTNPNLGEVAVNITPTRHFRMTSSSRDIIFLVNNTSSVTFRHFTFKPGPGSNGEVDQPWVITDFKTVTPEEVETGNPLGL